MKIVDLFCVRFFNLFNGNALSNNYQNRCTGRSSLKIYTSTCLGVHDLICFIVTFSLWRLFHGDFSIINFFTIYKHIYYGYCKFTLFFFLMYLFFLNMNQVSINLQVLGKFLVAETFYSMPNYFKPI